MTVLRKSLGKLRKLLTIALAIMVAFTFYYLGVYSERTGFVKEVLNPNLKKITLPVLNVFQSNNVEVAGIQLLLEPASLDSIAAIRDKALLGTTFREKGTWFPVSVVWNSDTLTGKLRLKGGLLDHLSTHKWSYRIRLSGNQRIWGCKSFSIQHPNVRNFTHEWLFHAALKQEGFPTIPYDFIEVKINDEQKGIHAFEGHFHAEWTDRFDSLAGPVMKYDDELRLIAIEEEPASASDPSLHPLAQWNAAPIDAFQLKKVLKNDFSSQLFTENFELLEGFRSGKLEASEVFEIEQLALLFAIGDVLGAQHAHDWRNLRFVQSAKTKRLIPVGFDANAGENILAIRALREQRPITFQIKPNDEFYEKLFNNKAFYSNYLLALTEVSSTKWLAQLKASTAQELQTKITICQKEYPRYEHDFESYMRCSNTIRRSLYPTKPATILFNPISRKLEIKNVSGLPLYIHSVQLNSNRTIKTKPFGIPVNGKVLISAIPELPLDSAANIIQLGVSTFENTQGILGRVITVEAAQ